MNHAEVARLARAVEALRMAYGSMQNAVVHMPSLAMMDALTKQGRELSITLRQCEQALRDAIQIVEPIPQFEELMRQRIEDDEQLQQLDTRKDIHDG